MTQHPTVAHHGCYATRQVIYYHVVGLVLCSACPSWCPVWVASYLQRKAPHTYITKYIYIYKDSIEIVITSRHRKAAVRRGLERDQEGVGGNRTHVDAAWVSNLPESAVDRFRIWGLGIGVTISWSLCQNTERHNWCTRIYDMDKE